MKKIFVILFVLAVMISSFSITVFADEIHDTESVDYVLECYEELENEIDAVSISLIVVSVFAAGSLCWNIISNYRINVLKEELNEHVNKNKNKRKKR